MQGTHIETSRKTVGVMAAIVIAAVAVRFGCTKISFAGAEKASLSLTTERGAGRSRPLTYAQSNYAFTDSPKEAGGLSPVEPPAFMRRFRVTAYCPCKKCCGRWADGFTASGHAICPGDLLCSADPNIPFGTRIFIPGYSEHAVRVLDRGVVIVGDRLDVLFYDGDLKTSHARALEWGDPNLECIIYDGS